MTKPQTTYNDFAFILTWPDATMRGDEKWMMFFKKIGLVKNLNFKVGHTGIVLVKKATGQMLFYDFGRYIAPRGYGRARSMSSDPNLEIKIRAEFCQQSITNLEEIIAYFECSKPAMYGYGDLFFSIAKDINFELAKAYGDNCVQMGTYPYGAVAKGNNNCSRFITRMLMYASQKYNWLHSINFPETIKASPISNVVNAVEDRMIYSFSTQQGLKHFKMNRWQSFLFLLNKLGDNISQKKADLLPSDIPIGLMDFNSRPIDVPKDAQYLGGVGDGAWFHAHFINEKHVIIKRFTTEWCLEYTVLGRPVEGIDPKKTFKFTYDSHLLFTHIIQNGTKIRINHVQNLSHKNTSEININELYA